MITFVIPSHNNLRHLKNVYSSIKRNASECKMIFLDDASTDGTLEWLNSLQDKNVTSIYRSSERVGHTILYDKGIELAETEVVGILHADMIVGPKYVENVMKHLKHGVVVCGTRVEPPLHPEGNEKIIRNFGMDFDDLDVEAFEIFCFDKLEELKDQTTKGMFAPWIIYKSDFVSMGGHDALFAPFPYEDSDIFQRWLLAGYELVQARDAFVYHLTCRGHRWTSEIQKDDEYFKVASQNAGRNYIRKWRSWIKNDAYQHPILSNKYDIGFVIKNCDVALLYFIEPWGTTTYIENESLASEYLKKAQSETVYPMQDRVKTFQGEYNHAVVIEVDGSRINNTGAQFITQLPDILSTVTEPGQYEFEPFKIQVNKVEPEKIDLPFVATKNVF
jgi:glycosyltransferase involved in cell wall biosynthesis